MSDLHDLGLGPAQQPTRKEKRVQEEASSTHPPKTSKRKKPSRKQSAGQVLLGVVGELLITIGVLVLLFMGWQLFFDDAVIANEQQDVAQEYVSLWDSEDAGTDEPFTGEVPALSSVADESVFAVLYVPRMGENFKRPIAEGVGREEVLDRLGAGHYPSTQLPGEDGNFAIASHRSGWGSNFRKIHNMRIGDEIIVRTADGWYTYRYRNTAYVMETQISVLNPVPDDTIEATDQIITLTSCNPYPFSQGERIIAYGVFESFQPRSDGPPQTVVDMEQ